MEVTKRCFKCGEVKPLNEFYEHPQMADGHLNKCKSCTKNDVKMYRASRPERELKTRLKACDKNPTHRNANRAVASAVRCGKLVPPDECQGCGRKASETRLSAHHHDYTKPLDVIWLCAACHRHVDRIRAVVESGVTWDEYRHKSNSKNAFLRRATEYYSEHVRTRNPAFDYKSFVNNEDIL